MLAYRMDLDATGAVWFSSDCPTDEPTEDICVGKPCADCLDYVPEDGGSFCGFSDAGCMLAYRMDLDATGAVWFSSNCPTDAPAEDICVGKPCADCLDYVPDDNESFCGFSDAGCMLAYHMDLDATGAVWFSSECPTEAITTTPAIKTTTGCADKCNTAQYNMVVATLEASGTAECTAMFATMSDNGPTEEQMSACYGSADFSSISNYDCKMECGDEKTVAGYTAQKEKVAVELKVVGVTEENWVDVEPHLKKGVSSAYNVPEKDIELSLDPASSRRHLSEERSVIATIETDDANSLTQEIENTPTEDVMSAVSESLESGGVEGVSLTEISAPVIVTTTTAPTEGDTKIPADETSADSEISTGVIVVIVIACLIILAVVFKVVMWFMQNDRHEMSKEVEMKETNTTTPEFGRREEFV